MLHQWKRTMRVLPWTVANTLASRPSSKHMPNEQAGVKLLVRPIAKARAKKSPTHTTHRPALPKAVSADIVTKTNQCRDSHELDVRKTRVRKQNNKVGSQHNDKQHKGAEKFRIPGAKNNQDTASSTKRHCRRIHKHQ